MYNNQWLVDNNFIEVNGLSPLCCKGVHHMAQRGRPTFILKSQNVPHMRTSPRSKFPPHRQVCECVIKV